MANRSANLRAYALIAVALTAPSIAACATSRTDVTKGCDTSSSAVSAAADYLIGRDNARDLVGVLAGYTDDIVWLPPSGEPVTGKDSIRGRYEGLFSRFKLDLHSTTLEAFAGRQIGFVRGSTNGTLTPLVGGPAIPVNDKFMAIMRCEAGVWRVSHLMWSPRSVTQSH